ncbi:MAG: hypothetical protein CMP23_10675 [Rickettsiales bacterium]|nr:hypothetical protein [Rickettsiales bacterium]
MMVSVQQRVSLQASLLLACSLLWALGGCRPDLEIQLPPTGAMLVGDAPVEVVVNGVAGAAQVEGLDNDPGELVEADDEGRVSRFVPAHDGLGFVTVVTEGSPRAYAVRSWHQGEFLDPAELQRDVATGRLDQPLLDSVTALVGQSLAQSNLARYAVNPVVLDTPVGDLLLNIRDAGAENVHIDVQVDAAGLVRLTARLTGVQIWYQAEQASLNWAIDYGTAADPIYGVGSFDWVEIAGFINLPSLLCDPDPTLPCEAGSFLNEVVVTHSEAAVDDPNCELLWGLLDLCGVVSSSLEEQLPGPLAAVAEAAAAHVLKHLVQSLDPVLDVQFERPIQRQLSLTGVRAEDHSVVLEYSGFIGAVTPEVAASDQGVLKRPMTSPGGSGICVGRPAINALSFAAWDAGNLRNIEFDNGQLVSFGLPAQVPWTDIRKATIEALLPPVLEYREDSAWLDLGGIRAVVDAGTWGEAVLFAAGQMPVRVAANDQGGLTLVLNLADDGSRQTRVLGVGFDEAHPLLDRGMALEIIEAVVPGLMSQVLRDLANLTIPEIVIPPLEGSGAVDLTGQVMMASEAVRIVEDAWCVPTTLEF